MTTAHNLLYSEEIVRDTLFKEINLKFMLYIADKSNINRITLSHLLNGHSGSTKEMAHRLSLLLSTTEEMWLDIQ
jgi:plasmid maintenance system antidote protein VapI